MNVLFLTTHLNTGGITIYLLTLTKGLRKMGYQVHIASSGGEMAKDFEALGAKLLTLNIRTKSELSPKVYLALAPLHQYINNNAIDIIHAQTRITQVIGQLLGNITRGTFVATCHGFFKPHLSRRLIPCWGTKTIAISPAVKDHLINDFGVAKHQIELIENGIDLEQFVHIDNEMKQKKRGEFNLGQGPLIGIIARLSDVKGQDILVRAMTKVVKKVPNVKLLLIGEGKLKAMLRQMVDDLNLNAHVQFFPIINRTSEMLSMLDIFVMPSRQEGLGLSVMEAQAAGLPVIASRIGGLPHLIDDGKTGLLVQPENSEHLAQALIVLLENKILAKQMGCEARKYAKKTYSENIMLDKTCKLYKRLRHFN